MSRQPSWRSHQKARCRGSLPPQPSLCLLPGLTPPLGFFSAFPWTPGCSHWLIPGRAELERAGESTLGRSRSLFVTKLGSGIITWSLFYLSVVSR